MVTYIQACGNENACGNGVLIYDRGINDTSIHFVRDKTFYKKACGNETACRNENACGNEVLISRKMDGISVTYPTGVDK
jgi:hypothetical protein